MVLIELFYSVDVSRGGSCRLTRHSRSSFNRVVIIHSSLQILPIRWWQELPVDSLKHDYKTLSKPSKGLPQTIPLKASGLVIAAHCTVALQFLRGEGSGRLPVECQQSSNWPYMVICSVKTGFFVQFAIQKK